MPKGHSAGRLFGDDALTEQLIGPGVESGDDPHQLRIEHLARHCRGHRGGARIVGKPGRPKEYGITHAVRQRNIRAVEELQPDGPGCRSPPAARAAASSVTYKGMPSVRSNTARRSVGAADPRVRSTSAAVASTSSGSTSTCRSWPERRSSLRIRRIE